MDYEKLHQKMAQYAFPICEMKTNKHDFIATSTLCKYAGRKFILNAGHTMQNSMDKNIPLAIRYKEKYISISKYPTKICYSEDGKNGNPYMDLAISILDHDNDILEDNFLDLDENIPEITHIIFFGYPHTRYKPYSDPPRAEFIRYTSEIINIQDIKNEKLNDDYHIIGKLIDENVRRIKDNGEEIQVKNLPSLQGLSGGPVVGINKHNSSTLCFAGMGILYNKKKKNTTPKYVGALKHTCIIEALKKVLSETSGD